MRKRVPWRFVVLLALLVTAVSQFDRDAAAGPAGRLIVAPSGGDFTTISAALASITPSAANPYVIEVMPGPAPNGAYVESVTMKSYVHLRGAGAETTVIQSPSTSTPVVRINGLTNVAISGLTLKGGLRGVEVISSTNVTIMNNRFTANSQGITPISSSPIVIGNVLTGNNGQGFFIVSNPGSSAPKIIANTITSNTSFGILTSCSVSIPCSPIVLGNTLVGNGGGVLDLAYSNASTVLGNTITGGTNPGIYAASSSTAVVLHNRITGNAPFDIQLNAGNPTVTHNIFDTLSGTLTRWCYNTKSDASAFGPPPCP